MSTFVRSYARDQIPYRPCAYILLGVRQDKARVVPNVLIKIINIWLSLTYLPDFFFVIIVYN